MQKLSAMLMAMLLVLGLGGCRGGAESDFVGTYQSTSTRTNAIVQLHADGTAFYQQTSTRTGNSRSGDTTWEIEGDRLIVRAHREISYDIYADISSGSEALLFRADNSNWHENFWLKVTD